MKPPSYLVALAISALLACGGCSTGGRVATRVPDLQVTPVTMHVSTEPVPVKGSDGFYHLVYELELSNFTGGVAAVREIEVLDANRGLAVATLARADIADRLVVRDRAAIKGSIGPSQVGLLYVHVRIVERAQLPAALVHRVSLSIDDKPSVEVAGRVAVASPTDLVLDAPLRGARYIAGDGCCDSVRHVRATLPLNGQLFTAQRFAIDWEQLDEQGRIYAGDPRRPENYVIYGKPIYAVAAGTVVSALDGLPDTPPGALPASIPIEQADGNHVVLDLGGRRYALFAHMAPGSVQVRAGDTVRPGQVIGRVGTSGNSSEPHLHFHVVDGPSALAANGLPYLLRAFSATQRGVSTASYDQASGEGKPVVLEPVARPGAHQNEMPLDLWVVEFPAP